MVHWEVNIDNYYGTISICAEDVICVFWHLDEETHNRFEYENTKANAKRICQCVNSHDALLERLHESTACLIALKITQALDEGVKKSVSQIIDKNNTAITQAKKE